MASETLTFHCVDVRAVVLKLRRPVLHIPDVPGVGLDWNEEFVAGNLYEA